MTVGRTSVGWKKASALAAGLLVVATGCAAGSGPAGTPSSSPTASTVPSSSVTATATTSATPTATAPVLANGGYAAQIVAVDVAHRTLTVDVVQLFLGAAASSAAAADHAPEVPPPNDVWIRNQSPTLRTLYVTTTAPITVNVLGASWTHSATTNVAVSLTRLAGLPGLHDAYFWLTVEHGVVARVAEQYLP